MKISRYFLLYLLLFALALKADIVFAQEILDSCFCSVDFEKKAKGKNPTEFFQTKEIYGSHCGISQWKNGHWHRYGDDTSKHWDFLEAHPLDSVPKGECLRMLHIGFAWQEEWDKQPLSDEFVCFRLSEELIPGEEYSFGFIYLTNGWDQSQKVAGFAPLVFTNDKPTLDNAVLVGRLPEAGADWSEGEIAFVADEDVSGHSWIVLHPGYGDPAGLIMAPCTFPFLKMLRADSITLSDTLTALLNSSELLTNGKIVLENVSFGFNTAILDTISYPYLDTLALFLNANPKIKIEIVGFTDDIGTAEYNQNLSTDRAGAVYNYLLTKNVQLDQISFRGMGENNPILPNTSDENRPINRRVEVHLISSE